MSKPKPKLPRRLVFVDTETTGTQFGRDRIIEIGLVLVEDNQIVSTFSSLVNPQTYVSPFIYQLTGINQKELDHAPLFENLLPSFENFFEDSVFVAHNARFDFAFFKSEYAKINRSFDPPLLCTVRLSRRLFPEFSRHNLDSLISRHQLPCQNRHRAFDDALVLFHFYNLMLDQKSEELEVTITSLLKTPTLPPHLQTPTLSLKNTPGVYIFYDDQKNPLYVGKSKNIKNRVLSHFSDTSRVPREMSLASRTSYIETQDTCGEMGALLLESHLVKELLPVHNRQLRPKKELLVLKKETTKKGYLTAVASSVSEINPDDLDSILGIYRSRRQLQSYLSDLAKEYQLCPKLLGIDHSKGACFSYHLDECLGACTGKESVLKYNLRFLEAFSDKTFVTWPFPGPVIITETHPETDKKQSYLVNRWILLAQFNPDTESCDIESLSSPLPSLDLDIYKILKRFIFNPKNHSLIHPVPKKVIKNRNLENIF